MPITPVNPGYASGSFVFYDGPNDVSALKLHGLLAPGPANTLAPPRWLKYYSGRAIAAAPLLSSRECAITELAAWIYLGGEPPVKFDVAILSGKSFRLNVGYVNRICMNIDQADIITINNVKVTHPARTALDLFYAHLDRPPYGYISGIARLCGGYDTLLRRIPNYPHAQQYPQVEQIIRTLYAQTR